ncbi:ribosome biogenesis GTP-binding protein YihA/YsxC [Chitinivibrio alkaliphilus]|uniref:Probable GTP-binding protein EngB n=1 Tax=Chitinivibrio alkaliphilus ACht1 TaxID=1313304 RepID=U7DB96_9BACT|nr:ribosome biogenesis GTP-binding protein YihA/YsxC [Chitinivibrio alkaliphilus]ERP39277.1 ribosome biogenesis GTP-binding protein YsxC [Chitinivibrio alkaliphilus ACht1]
MAVYREYFSGASVDFLTSAADLSGCPAHERTEFALFGRSNVGKSSFLNHIFESKKLVRVSREPGKTRLLNFFSFTDEISFVDLPGYGYARVSKKDRADWSGMIASYCEQRENLAGLIWLLDYRRERGTTIDREAANWLATLGIPVFVVLTKSDKLNRKERQKKSAFSERGF